jgi:hypothetical protein
VVGGAVVAFPQQHRRALGQAIEQVVGRHGAGTGCGGLHPGAR